jgi:L-histidine N-alpha-methyltransferase
VFEATHPAPEPTLDVRLTPAELGALVVSEVAAGLNRPRARLPLHHLVDRTTLAVWDALELTEAYYPARMERGLLAAYTPLALQVSGATTVVALGHSPHGALEAMVEAGVHTGALRRVVVVVDALVPTVQAAAAGLSARHPGLDVQGIVADPVRQLETVPVGGPCLLVVGGATLGVLDRADRSRLLNQLAHHLGPGDSVLAAVDLVKDRSRLLEARDDPEGLQAQRTRNALAILCRELGAAIDLDGWRHEARWDERAHVVSARLRARGTQRVAIAKLGIDRTFADGEAITMETASVFVRNGLDAELAFAGLGLNHWWPDPSGSYALALASR